jgi:uncharacterized membrane protein
MALHPSVRDVFQKLRGEGLLPPEAEEIQWRAKLATAEAPAPWFVRILIGFGAWVAALLFIGFLAVAKVLDDKSVAIVLGLILIAGAAVLRYKSRHDFAVQLAIAVSLAGQGLFLTGVGDRADEKVVALVALPLEVALVVVFPDRVHRFLSSAAVAFLLVWIPWVFHWPIWTEEVAVWVIAGIAGYAWLEQANIERGPARNLQGPIAMGFATALCLILLVGAVPPEFRFHEHLPNGSIAAIGLTVGLFVLTYRILQERGVPLLSDVALVPLAGAGLLGVAAWRSPGIVATVGLLAFGFHRRNTVLLGIAIAFLVLFLSAYYYELQLTLLEKSGVLIGSGVLLLGLRFYVRWRAGSEKVA